MVKYRIKRKGGKKRYKIYTHTHTHTHKEKKRNESTIKINNIKR